MEHTIGKPFKVFGVSYVAVEGSEDGRRCNKCAAGDFCGFSGNMRDTFGQCADYRRSDGKNVYFKQFGVDF